MKKKKANEHTIIGVDSLEIQIASEQRTKIIEETEIYSKTTGEKIFTIKSQSKTGFRLSICLPKMVRANNLVPFGIMDEVCLLDLVNEISDILTNTFDVNLKMARVSTVEVNATATLHHKENINCIMNLLTLMFLQNGTKIFITAHGKDDERYNNVPLSQDVLRKVLQVESLKTPRLGNHRFAWKIYDKGLEQGMQDKGILRLEQIHSKKSLEYAKIDNRLDMFLTPENIRKLIRLYRNDFEQYFINLFWQDKSGNSFINKCVNTILMELEEETPLSTAKIHRELLSIDYGLFEQACYRFYQNRKTATQAIRRVRESGKIEIHKGAISELVQIFRAILRE